MCVMKSPRGAEDEEWSADPPDHPQSKGCAGDKLAHMVNEHEHKGQKFDECNRHDKKKDLLSLEVPYYMQTCIDLFRRKKWTKKPRQKAGFSCVKKSDQERF